MLLILLPAAEIRDSVRPSTYLIYLESLIERPAEPRKQQAASRVRTNAICIPIPFSFA